MQRMPTRPQTPSSEQGDSEVQDDEKEKPHDVDEVPVESHRCYADMILLGELPSRRPVENDRQKDQTTEHVRPVETGHHEEGAGKCVGRKGHAPCEGGNEFVQLTELESQS